MHPGFLSLGTYTDTEEEIEGGDEENDQPQKDRHQALRPNDQEALRHPYSPTSTWNGNDPIQES